MDNNWEIQTPRTKCRSLGLNRSIKRTSVPKTPASDLKINYKSLQDDQGLGSPSTPSAAQKLPLRSVPFTTNCLPYRLSLSRRVRDRYKKKKLEFVAVENEPEAECLLDNKSLACDAEQQQSTDLLQEIMTKERVIQSHHNHQKKVQELQSLINTWKEAFCASLSDLSSKVEPKVETEDLIARLGIPPEMIEYT